MRFHAISCHGVSSDFIGFFVGCFFSGFVGFARDCLWPIDLNIYAFPQEHDLPMGGSPHFFSFFMRVSSCFYGATRWIKPDRSPEILETLVSIGWEHLQAKPQFHGLPRRPVSG